MTEGADLALIFKKERTGGVKILLAIGKSGAVAGIGNGGAEAKMAAAVGSTADSSGSGTADSGAPRMSCNRGCLGTPKRIVIPMR